MLRLSPEQLEVHRYLRWELPMTLAEVARGASCVCRHVEDDDGIVLQPAHFRMNNRVIRRMRESEQSLFAMGLCWMVWVDQAMWTYHHDAYARFREVTRFPKLVGDCLGGCHTHLHPRAALGMVGSSGNSRHNRLARYAMLAGSAPVVENLLQCLARQHNLPMLPALLRNDSTAMGLSGYGWGRELSSGEPRAEIDEINWRMPAISLEQFREAEEYAEPQHRPVPPPHSTVRRFDRERGRHYMDTGSSSRFLMMLMGAPS